MSSKRAPATECVRLGLVLIGALLAGVLLVAATGEAGILDASWIAPTTNTDGSPLTDLASYNLYYGTAATPCPGSSFFQVASPTSTPSPNQTMSARLTGLATGTRYYVSVSAVDTNGNQSACSSAADALARTDFGVSPAGTMNFGTVNLGTFSDRTFTVSNTGGGTISGAASVPAPFSIVSGSPFNLSGVGASQAVTVRFTPTTTATVSATIAFAASGGTVSAIVTGSGGGTTDTTSPTATITSPTSGPTYATKNASVTLQGTALDNVSVTQVTWTNSRGGSGTASGTTAWTIGAIALQLGSNVLTVTARDAAGNTGTAILTVTSDTAPPSVGITAPVSGATVSGTAAVLAAASDNVGVVGVQFLLDGAALGPEQTSAPFSLTWTTSSVADGSHTLSARARDAAGNVALSANVALTVSNTVPIPQPLPQALVAVYAFNEGAGYTVADASGNNNTGTFGSGVTWTSQGRFGKALVFNGGGFVTIPAAASLNLTTGMTLEAWVYPTATRRNWSTILMKEQPRRLAYALYAASRHSRPGVYFNTWTSAKVERGRGTTGPSPLRLNTWSHLAGTYDGVTLKLYVNGVPVVEKAFSGSIQASTGALRIGGNGLWGEYFQGRIDEIRIYNRALSQTEIQADMTTAIGVTTAGATAP